MYNDDYVYNGPLGTRDHDENGYARYARSYDLPHDADSRDAVCYPWAATRSEDLLDALSQLHARQEHIMAALFDSVPDDSAASPSPALASSFPSRLRQTTTSPPRPAWPARPVSRHRSPSVYHGSPRAMRPSPRPHRSVHTVYDDELCTRDDRFVDVDPLFARQQVHNERPHSPMRARDRSATFADPADDIYESLYGRRLDPFADRRTRPASALRRPLLKSTATVQYYQRAASQNPTPPSEERGAGDDESVRNATLANGVDKSGRASAHRVDTDTGCSQQSTGTHVGMTRAVARSSSTLSPTTRNQGPTSTTAGVAKASKAVVVEPRRSATWAFKLAESVMMQTATRSRSCASSGSRDATDEDDRDGAASADSVAALTVQCLGRRAGALRWRPLLTDLAVSVHAYQHVCPACAVFRHYFIDNSPKSVVLFRLFCVIWQATLRASHVVTQSASTASRTTSIASAATTLVSRRYIDLREITMLLSVVLSALTVPEVRFAMGSRNAAHTTAFQRGVSRATRQVATAAASSRASSVRAATPRFKHRTRRLHASEQREVQKLLLDWMNQSIPQARALRRAVPATAEDPPHGNALAEANLLAFDREGFVDAHALAQATVEALDVLLTLYEPETAEQSGQDEAEGEDSGSGAIVPDGGAARLAPSSVATKMTTRGEPERALLPSSQPPPSSSSPRPRVVPVGTRGEVHWPDVRADLVDEHRPYAQSHCAGDHTEHPEALRTDSEEEDDEVGMFADNDPHSPSVTGRTRQTVDEVSARAAPGTDNVLDQRFSNHRIEERMPPPPRGDEPQPWSSHSSTEYGAPVRGDDVDEALIEAPLPQRRASTPPPSAVKRQKEEEAAEQGTSHTLTRRLLDVDVSDYLDDFAADMAEEVPPPVAASETYHTPDQTSTRSLETAGTRAAVSRETRAPLRSSASALHQEDGAHISGESRAPPPPATPTVSVQRPPRAPAVVSPIRVVNGESTSAPVAHAKTIPPPPPKSSPPPAPAIVATSAADDQQPLSAIERYRQRRSAQEALNGTERSHTQPTTVPPSSRSSVRTVPAENPRARPQATFPKTTRSDASAGADRKQRSAATAALLSEVKSRLRQLDARRANAQPPE